MPNSTTFVTTGKNSDGKTVTTEITITKTDDDKGSIRTKKWVEPKERGNDDPNVDESFDLKDIKAKRDGSKLTAEVDVSWYDPKITIEINCPVQPPDPAVPKKKPSVKVIVTDGPDSANGTTVYEITEAIQDQLLNFVRQSNYPNLAALNSGTGMDGLAALVDRPSLFNDVSLGRLALGLSDVAYSIANREDDWLLNNRTFKFIGHDPGIKGKLKYSNKKERVKILISISKDLFTKGELTMVDGFIHPNRTISAQDIGTNANRPIVDLSFYSEAKLNEFVETINLQEVVTRLVDTKAKTIGYELKSGKKITSAYAYELAEMGLLKGIEGAKRGNTVYIRASKDLNEANNLDKMEVKICSSNIDFDTSL